jgi:hypothetical protein
VNVEFAELIESAVIDQRVAKSGAKYHMLTLKLEGGIEFSYICMKGEENVIKLLEEQASKK